METKTTHPPSLNINVLIQNYINVYNNKEEQTFFNHGPESKYRNDIYPKETAKQSPSTPKMKQEPSPRLGSIGSLSTLGDSDDINEISAKMTKNQGQIYETREEILHENHIAEIIGCFFIGFAAFLFIMVLYALIVSPLIGSTGHVLLDFIREDFYYCFLFPLLMPTTFAMIYLNWVSIKFFRHS